MFRYAILFGCAWLGAVAIAAVPSAATLGPKLKGFSFGFEVEFVTDMAEQKLAQARDQFGFFAPELDVEKTGNYEVRTIPVTDLETLFTQLDAVKANFPGTIRSIHVHIRFPLNLVRQTTEFEGYVSQIADAIALFRLGHARNNSISLKSDTVRRNSRETIFSRGAVRLQFIEGYDLELRGFMANIAELKQSMLPILDAISNNRFPKGTSAWQRLVTNVRQDLGAYLRDNYGLKLDERAMQRVDLVSRAVVDDTAFLPLSGFEFSPFIDREAADIIRGANGVFFTALSKMIADDKVKDEILGSSTRNLIQKWGRDANLEAVLLSGLDTSEAGVRNDWNSMESLQALARWQEVNEVDVSRVLEAFPELADNACAGVISQR